MTEQNKLNPAKSLQLKNHAAPKGRRLQQALKTKFGVTLNDFDKACQGDLASAQKIGEMARQGARYKEFAPKIAELYSDIIEGTEAFNKAQADILQSAGKSAISIDKAAAKTQLANTKYSHERSELALDFHTQKQAENQRHQYSMNMAQVKGYIDAHLVSVDRQVAILEQTQRPEVKQILSDEQQQKREINEALDRGGTARFDLIPEKKYTGIKGKLLEMKAALGF